MTKRRLSTRKKSVAIMALLVVAVGIALFAGGRVVDAWSQATTQYPEHDIALSFLNTGHLPSYAPAGTPKSITFRLSNNEAAPMTYHYRALLVAGTTPTVLLEDTVTLGDSASIDKTLTFTLPQPEMNAQVTVQLIDRTEYITFGTAS